MDITALVHEVAEAIGRSGQARAVFGDPLKLDTQTIIPVAVVMTRLGGGGGTTAIIGGGGGVGMHLDVLPVGFIHEKDGVATFTALDLPLERLALLAQKPRGRKSRDERANLLERLQRHFARRD